MSNSQASDRPIGIFGLVVGGAATILLAGVGFGSWPAKMIAMTIVAGGLGSVVLLSQKSDARRAYVAAILVLSAASAILVSLLAGYRVGGMYDSNPAARLIGAFGPVVVALSLALLRRGSGRFG